MALKESSRVLSRKGIIGLRKHASGWYVGFDILSREKARK